MTTTIGIVQYSHFFASSSTANLGYGYFEDRRPAANMDPYEVCAMLIETVCGEY